MDESKPSLSVIFVLGGPGAGKGTQCAILAAKYGYAHLSLGDVLRTEVENPDSTKGRIIEANMREGTLAPAELTLELLSNAIRKKSAEAGKNRFLIDGIPRRMDQAVRFEETICEPSCVLVLECPDEILRQRLEDRAMALGRFDDSADIITKRICTFRRTTSLVLDHYAAQGKLRRVDAANKREKVTADIEASLFDLL